MRGLVGCTHSLPLALRMTKAGLSNDGQIFPIVNIASPPDSITIQEFFHTPAERIFQSKKLK
jgi:hypothetical protein